MGMVTDWDEVTGAAGSREGSAGSGKGQSWSCYLGVIQKYLTIQRSFANMLRNEMNIA